MKNRFRDIATGSYTMAEVETIFGPKSDARIAQQLMVEQPEVYRELRAIAQQRRLVDAPGYSLPREQREEKAVSAEQVNAMAEFSREECVRYFKSGSQAIGTGNAAQLQKEDPPKYARLKLAAQGHNVLPGSGSAVVVNHRSKQARPKPGVDGKFLLDNGICDELGVAQGTRVTNAEFDKISTETLPFLRRSKERREQEAAAEAAAKAAAAAKDGE
jgi:hypothetical protein